VIVKSISTILHLYISLSHLKNIVQSLLLTRVNKYLVEDVTKRKQISKYSIQRTLDTIKRKLNIEQSISPHKWRHSLATNLLNNNVNLYNIQKILGHSSISTTQIYLHAVDKGIKIEITSILKNKKSRYNVSTEFSNGAGDENRTHVSSLEG